MALAKLTKKEKRKYQVREEACLTRDCFIPFEGNGIKICRLYEMGQCPDKYTKGRQEGKAKTLAFNNSK